MIVTIRKLWRKGNNYLNSIMKNEDDYSRNGDNRDGCGNDSPIGRNRYFCNLVFPTMGDIVQQKGNRYLVEHETKGYEVIVMRKLFRNNLMPIMMVLVIMIGILPVQQAKAASCSHGSYSTRTFQPTCTQEGRYETYCTKCGKVVNGGRTSAALGHKYRIWDESGTVSIKCCRDNCRQKLASKVYDLDSFSKYYKAQGKVFSYYVTAAQDAILSCWLRYTYDFSDRETADRMVEYYRKSNADWVPLPSSKIEDAKKFIEACAVLGQRTHKNSKGKVVYDFKNADNLSHGLCCNAYIGFLELKGNIKNDTRYKVFKWSLTGLSLVNKDFKYAYKAAKWLISGYANICNLGISLCYQYVRRSDILDFACWLDNESFYNLVMNLDVCYKRVLDKPYGQANEASHNNFIAYVNYRLNEEFKRIWGVELSSIKGL